MPYPRKTAGLGSDSTYDLLEMLSMPNLVGLQSMEAKGRRQVRA